MCILTWKTLVIPHAMGLFLNWYCTQKSLFCTFFTSFFKGIFWHSEHVFNLGKHHVQITLNVQFKESCSAPKKGKSQRGAMWKFRATENWSLFCLIYHGVENPCAASYCFWKIAFKWCNRLSFESVVALWFYHVRWFSCAAIRMVWRVPKILRRTTTTNIQTVIFTGIQAIQ